MHVDKVDRSWTLNVTSAGLHAACTACDPLQNGGSAPW